jgi:hypothetical protein
MLGRRRSTNNMPVQGNYYDRHDAEALSIYNADLVPPATSYASTRSKLRSHFAIPTIGPKVGGPYVDHHWRLNGLRNMWAWGGTNQYTQTASLPGNCDKGLNGFVRSSAFQPILVQLHDWQTNAKWYICWNGTGSGMFAGSKPVRYTYPSFRVDQVDTSVTGGPGQPSMRMNRTPRFTSVQAIKKYTATPSRYNTRGTGK